MNIVRVICFIGHKFRIRGNDHMEGLQSTLETELGKDRVYLYNKRGGIMYVMFLDDLNEKDLKELCDKVSQICNFEYLESIVENYSAEYEQNLKDKFGDKIIVSGCL